MNTQADFKLADGTLAAKESRANIEMNVNADGTTAEAIILPTTTLDGVKRHSCWTVRLSNGLFP